MTVINAGIPKTSARPSTTAIGTDTLWGFDVHALHDRLWAARGLTIVRPGTMPPATARGTFVLVNHHDLIVDANLESMAQTFSPRARLCRLDLYSKHGPNYAEVLETDADDRLLRLTRRYTSQRTSSGNVMMTRDASLARRWCATEDAHHASVQVRRCVDVHRYARRDMSGIMLHAETFNAARRVLPSLLSMVALCAPDLGVVSIGDGVWAPVTTEIPDGARIVGPVWIGTNIAVHAGDRIIGPAIVFDQIDDTPDDTHNDSIGLRHTQIEAHEAPRVLALPTTQQVNRRSSPVPTARRFGWTKRLFDIMFSLCALALTLPLYPLVMVLILLEDGRPFFFGHVRQTRGGTEFRCLKFRTMCRNAESRRRSLEAENASDGPQFHVRNDPRVLRVGRWLRRLHIDEWPQFWNILRGDMSVVGPRPSPEPENQFCPPWRDARLSVRPGLTGLWQVMRTREPMTDFQEWIRYDLAYIHRRTWRLDLWIILRTVMIVMMRRG